MEFPLGSLAVLIVFILITSNLVEIDQPRQKIISAGLVGILLGGFVQLPLPSTKGTQISLNIGQSFIPCLMALMLWFDATIEEKYRVSLGTLAVGLTLYGFAALVDLEPGIMRFPELFSLPIIACVALLTGRTALGSSLAMVGGGMLVVLIRYLEVILFFQGGTYRELPGNLVWNTISLGAITVVTLNWTWEKLRSLSFRARNTNKEPDLVLGQETDNNQTEQIISPDN
ncbi:MAG TPA: hypothetical protein VNU93_00275 [Verrucomicrobiae bacterium]|nr:hypothetical protein [Verrucomicrobiae bacterium]